MTYRIITVQFAIPHDDPAFHVINFRDEIQEALFDEHGLSGSFNVVGVKDESGDEETAIRFQDQGFDAATVIPNASEVLSHESAAKSELWYHVDGWINDDTLAPDPEAKAPFEIFDVGAQRHIPGTFEDRAEAEAQAKRMNDAMRKTKLRSIAIKRQYPLSA